MNTESADTVKTSSIGPGGNVIVYNTPEEVMVVDT